MKIQPLMRVFTILLLICLVCPYEIGAIVRQNDPPLSSLLEPDVIAVGLADKDDCVRLRAWIALKEIGQPAVPALVKTLEHKQASTRRLAAETLGRVGSSAQDAVPALVLRLRDDSSVVRATSLEALQRIGMPRDQVVSAIASSLDDKDPHVREEAVWALSRIGHDAKIAAPSLRRIKGNDNDESVRLAARTALKKIGPTTILEYILVYYYYPLLVMLVCLVYILYLRGRNNKAECILNIIPACFGHPVYLVLAAYITFHIGLQTDGRDGIHLNNVGYTVVIIALFVLRSIFFLYLTWMHTRSPMEEVLPQAAIAYCRVHRYCLGGILLYIWLLFPIPTDETGLLYFLVFVIAGFAGMVVTLKSVGRANNPETWLSWSKCQAQREAEGGDLVPLTAEEGKKRKWARVFIWCLVLMIIGFGIALIWSIRAKEVEGTQEMHYQRMLARYQPGTAKYHHMLGQRYAGIYPVNLRMNREEGYAQALEEYSKAIALDPNLARTYRDRGYAYMGVKDYNRAIDDFNAFERLSDVVDSRFYGGRARAYEALGMKDKMCEDYQRSCCGPVCEDYKRKVEEGLCKDWRQ